MSADTKAVPVSAMELVSRLHSEPLRDVETWGGWLAEWPGVTSHAHAMGLLHSGFSMRIDMLRERHEFSQRLCFYLKLADGHRNGLLTAGRLRQKAWKTLVMACFNPGPMTLNLVDEWWFMLWEEPFDCILNFFLKTGNLPYKGGQTIEERTARAFIENFAEVAWVHSGTLSMLSDATRRQQLFRLLIRLGTLEVVCAHDEYLRDEDLVFLRGIAQEGNGRATLEEICVGRGEDAYVARILISAFAKRRGRAIKEELKARSHPKKQGRIAALRSRATSSKL